jgi:probable rRNA maturation factor
VNPVRNKTLTRRKDISKGVKITIKNFQKKIPVNPERIRKVILKVLSKEGARVSGEITICFVDDRRIQELNLKYRHKNVPTDVLAFNLSPRQNLWRGDVLSSNKSGSIYADIIVSAQTAIRNSEIFKTVLFYELDLYVIHGILHLLGYNDRSPKQKQLMRQKEKEYVNT